MSHTFQTRVYWEDTDAGGIVYHANYLKFAERARTEMVREAGIDQAKLADNGRGHAFAVKRVEMDYLKSARLEDSIQVETDVLEVGGASMDLSQTIKRLDDDAILVRLQIRLAFISLDGRPARMPAELRAQARQLVSERL